MKSISNKFPAFIYRFALALVFTVFVFSPSYAVNVTLGWDANDEPDLEGYKVYHNIGSPGPPFKHRTTLPETKLADPLNPMVTLTGLKEDTDYYVALTAYDADGNESYYSDDICVQVVDSAIELCGSSSSSSSSGGSGDSDGRGGGGSSVSCFISSASLKTACPGASSFFSSYPFYILFSLLILLLFGAAGSIFLKIVSRPKARKLEGQEAIKKSSKLIAVSS